MGGGANSYVDRVTRYNDRTETTTNITLNINEQMTIANAIFLGYKVTGEPFDKFKLGFSAGPTISFGSQTQNQYTRAIGKTAVKYNWNTPGYVEDTETLTYTTNNNTETSNFGLSLALNMGAKYILIKGKDKEEKEFDRFSINAGIGATPLSYSYRSVKTIPNYYNQTETTKRTEDDGSVTVNEKTVRPGTGANNTPTINDSIVVTDSWNPWTATLSGGFEFKFSPNAGLDLGLTSAANFAAINLTSVNVIFTFKF